MIKLLDPLPRYLLEPRQIWTIVVYTVLFSLVFILINIPFSENAWFSLGAGQVFFHTLSFLLISATVVVLSRQMLSRCQNLKRFTLLSYILWVVGEVVFLSLLYSFFTHVGVRLGVITPYLRNIVSVFFSAMVYITVCLCVPYFILSFYFVLQDKNNTMRLMDYGSVVSDAPAVPYNDNRITLFDNNGVLKFSISSDNLYFIESDDNYIKAWYMDSAGEIKQYMLRCRLKTVEDSFADSELVRCHRKYIVNIRKVSILKSEKEGYKIDFDIDSLEPIPISKTYEQAVLARFNSR